MFYKSTCAIPATMADTSSGSELAVSDSDPDESPAFPALASNIPQPPALTQPSSLALDDRQTVASQNQKIMPTRPSTFDQGRLTAGGDIRPYYGTRLTSQSQEMDEYGLCQLLVNVKRTDMFKSMPKMTRPRVSVTAIGVESGEVLSQLDPTAHPTNTETVPVRLQHATVVQPIWNDELHLPVQWPLLESKGDDSTASGGIALVFKLYDELPAPKTRRRAFDSQDLQANHHVHAFAFLNLTAEGANTPSEHRYIDKDLRLQWYSAHSVRKQLKHHPTPELLWYPQRAKSSKLKFSLHIRLSIRRLLAASLTGPHSPSPGSDDSRAMLSKYSLLCNRRRSSCTHWLLCRQPTWDRLPHAPYRLPNTVHACLQTGGKQSTAASFSHDGLRLAVATTHSHIVQLPSYSIVLYEIQPNHSTSGCEPIATFSHHQAVIYNVSWSSYSQRLASASADGLVVIWDGTGSSLQPITILPHSTYVYCCLALPANSRNEPDMVLSGSYDGVLRLWRPATKRQNLVSGVDVASNQLMQQLLLETQVHPALVNTLCYDSSSSKVYIGAGDGTIKVWSLTGMHSTAPGLTLLHTIQTPALTTDTASSVQSLGLLPSQRLLAKTSAGIYIFNLATLALERRLEASVSSTTGSSAGLAVSPDAAHILVATRIGLLCYKTATLAPVALPSSWALRPSVAGVVCHPHEHMAVVLHDTMLGATVIKYTSGKPLPMNFDDVNSLHSVSTQASVLTKQPIPKLHRPIGTQGDNLQQLLDLKQSYADDLLRTATERIIRQSAHLDEPCATTTTVASNATQSLYETADLVAEHLKAQLQLIPASALKQHQPLGHRGMKDTRLSVSFGHAHVLDDSELYTPAQHDDQVSQLERRAPPPTPAVEMATPLNLTARRRRRRDLTAAKLSASLHETSYSTAANLGTSLHESSAYTAAVPHADATAITIPQHTSINSASLPLVGLAPSFANTSDAFHTVQSDTKTRPANLASRRQRRAERRLSAARLRGQPEPAAQRRTTPTLLADGAEMTDPINRKATGSLPGETDAI